MPKQKFFPGQTWAVTGNKQLEILARDKGEALVRVTKSISAESLRAWIRINKAKQVV